MTIVHPYSKHHLCHSLLTFNLLILYIFSIYLTIHLILCSHVSQAIKLSPWPFLLDVAPYTHSIFHCNLKQKVEVIKTVQKNPGMNSQTLGEMLDCGKPQIGKILKQKDSLFVNVRVGNPRAISSLVCGRC